MAPITHSRAPFRGLQFNARGARRERDSRRGSGHHVRFVTMFF